LLIAQFAAAGIFSPEHKTHVADKLCALKREMALNELRKARAQSQLPFGLTLTGETFGTT
jgi:hypothetical protein